MKARLALAEGTYVCTQCALVLDLDVSAARNRAALGEAKVAGSGPELPQTDVEAREFWPCP